MSNNPLPQPTSQQPVVFEVFLPMVILSLALIVILVWTLVVSSFEYSAANRQRDQLIGAQVQANNVEQKVKSLMEGLLNLAETDPDAKAIAEKYQIRFNQPAGGTQQTPLTPGKVVPAPQPAPPAAPSAAGKPTAAPETGAKGASSQPK